MTKQQCYPSDLTDDESHILEPLVIPIEESGRPAKHTRREIVNAILYVTRTGCQWRYLPHDLPPWETVYVYFQQKRLKGTWKRIHDTLRKQLR